MPTMPTASDRMEALEQDNARLRALLREAGIEAAGDTAAPLAEDPSRPGDQTALRLLEEGTFTRLLIDSLSQGFYSVDRNGLTTLCNAAFLDMLGFKNQSEVLGKSLHRLIHHTHPDGSPHHTQDCPIYKAARDGVASTVPYDIFFRTDGSSFPVEFRARPIYREGELQGAICTFFDITDRLRSERDLRDSQQRLALAVAAARIGIWDYRPASAELRCDERARALFGLTTDGPVTMARKLEAVHPEDRAHVAAAIDEALDPAGPGSYDATFRTGGLDGTERWVAVSGHSTAGPGGARRFIGVAQDVSEAKRAELHLRLMVNELNHRVKNSLAMVQAVAAQTFRLAADPAVALKTFTERLVALARAHDILTAKNWESGDLRTIVDQTLTTHLGHPGDRVRVVGEAVALSPKSSMAMALALHELATNAVKHGALSVEDGAVAITWAVTSRPEGARLHFTWQESGGPVVELPQRRGFGSKLIERGLASELQGEVVLEFPAEGVLCTIDAPYSFRVT